jgi:hypothetical protein
MRLTENKIRQYVRESIKHILKESKTNIYNIVFVSYGTDSFSEENFKTPTFDDVINKPRGGFWGSPIDSKYGWGQWSDDNDFNIMSLDKHVLFKVKKSSIIYIIDTKEDLDNISKQVSMYDDQKDDMIKTMLAKYNNDMRYYKAIVKAVEDYISKYSTNVIDFDRLIKNYDGIYVTDNAVRKLRHVADGTGLYTWDVESICIFNPNAIEIIPETAFDKTMVPSYEEGVINPYEEDEVDDIFGYSGNRMQNKKQKQINKAYELYGNRNINSDSSNLFNGEHPGILAQGHGNSKKTKLAKKYNGTIKSGLD